MKKKLIIPSLLLACSLTACSDGLVTSGVAYEEGVTAKVDESLKSKKKGSYTVLTIKSEATTILSIKADGKTSTAKSTAKGTIIIDLNEKSVDLTIDSVSKSGQNTIEIGGSIKAKKTNGSFQIVRKDGEVGDLYASADFNSYLTTAVDNTYSWNFSLSDSEIRSAIANVSTTDSASLTNAMTRMRNTMMIDGDPSKGTFAVGISKEIEFSSSGTNCEISKMKYTYKDCLLDSSIMQVVATASNVKCDLTAKYNYSYK